ncbi:MAG: GPP34 family phosphoprotein [Alphaproteobacteria bacterium]
MVTSLTLPQSLLLLTLNDESGRPKAGLYKPAIAGAGVSEFLLRGRLTLTEEKKPKLVVTPTMYTQGPFLNLILSTIASDRK